MELGRIIGLLSPPGGLDAQQRVRDLKGPLVESSSVGKELERSGSGSGFGFGSGFGSRSGSAGKELELKGINSIQWASLPRACRIRCEGGETSPKAKVRIERKEAQVESFILALNSILRERRGKEGQLRVVDFGCGSGNLLLPLAVHFPLMSFLGIDQKPEAIHLLQTRAEEAGVGDRVSRSIERIEDHRGSFDVALTLHVCGR